MNIITEPNVHVLGTMQFHPHPEYELPVSKVYEKQADDNHRIIAHAGKGCYDSYGLEGRSIEDHIANLIDTRHGSVLEHAVVCLFITGISRGLSHEFVRHRPFAYSQRSTRYTKEDGASIVLDPFYAEIYTFLTKDKEWQRFETTHKANESTILSRFLQSCENSLTDYKQAVEDLMKIAPENKSATEKRKWARGKARQLLPHALETRMTVTANLRAWRWFIEERSGPQAEPEIRRLAKYVFEAIEPLAPLVFGDYKMLDFEGFPVYITEWRKV